MPLSIEIEKGLHKPVVVCDHCRRRIATVRDGNYQWDMYADGGPLFFTHKACCHAFEQARPEVFWGAMELECLLVYLANNLRLDWKRARRTTALLNSIGP